MTMDPTDEDIVRMTNEALADLGNSIRELDDIHNLKNKLIQDIKDWQKERVEELEARIEDDMKTIRAFWRKRSSALRDSKDSKTATLLNGTISERLNPISLRIDDVSGALKYLGKMGVLRQFTHRPPRVIDKEALKRNPAFVDRIPKHIMYLIRERTLHIKPSNVQVTSKRASASLTIPLDDDKEG
jgi:phage host-nuclease inhibitor protein Gam